MCTALVLVSRLTFISSYFLYINILCIGANKGYYYYNIIFYQVPDAPLNFRNVSRSTESISIMWDPPTKSNGILVGYKVSGELVIIGVSDLHIACKYCNA